jgi:DNA-binding YbaB/EbfC family protein
MFDFKNFGKIMDQAKKLQAQLKEKQDLLGKEIVVGQAGGNIVSIESTCRYQVLRVTLDPAFSNEDTATQQELIKIAFNDTTRKIEEKIQGSMSDLAAQLPSAPGSIEAANDETDKE